LLLILTYDIVINAHVHEGYSRQ